MGVVCLTPQNWNRPWILFEAGALSKSLDDKTRVCTYLLGELRPGDVVPPLGMFQATKAEKADTRKLIGTINRAVGGPLSGEQLDTLFEQMWPRLEAKLSAIRPAEEIAGPERTQPEMVAEILELSRSAASSGASSAEKLSELLRSVGEVLGHLRPSTYFSGLGLGPTSYVLGGSGLRQRGMFPADDAYAGFAGMVGSPSVEDLPGPSPKGLRGEREDGGEVEPGGEGVRNALRGRLMAKKTEGEEGS